MDYRQCKQRQVKFCSANNECIYNLLPKPFEKTCKPSLYTSKFASLVKNQIKQQTKYGHKTFGYAHEPLKSPQEFLKKHARNPAASLLKSAKKESSFKPAEFNSEPTQCAEPKRQSNLKTAERREFIGDGSKKPKNVKQDKKNTKKEPKVLEESCPDAGPVSNIKKVLKEKKNFITLNALSVIGGKPTEPAKKMIVFTRKGDKLNFSEGGLDMKYCRSEKFGKKPKYLESRRELVEDARDEYDDKISERMRAGALKKLTEDERDNMLACLQESHKKLNEQYNKLPIIMRTVYSKNAKMKLELQLAQLEKDIRLISAHPEIYIAN